ncbi:hypothetical protein [Echinimonas agarilytica]|uniref:Uncharacterized protein n=1 Tax=Echinimonas agarilytica TaxID=1215918 RepID=A0AA42B736_9GAMM|nr:hypothetical protein [Echinimonas agarilytica]MCM2679196.1 hypothetical protein [Echinimonas agarilytica]
MLQKINLKLVVAFGLYGTGLFALLLADLMISAFWTETQIANWAEFKSLLFIVGGLAALGCDQAVLRFQHSGMSIIRYMVPRSALFIVIATIGYAQFSDDVDIAIAMSASLCFALLSLFAGNFRASQLFVLSQLSTQTWKILLLFMLLASYFFLPELQLQQILVGALAAAVAFAIVMGWKTLAQQNEAVDRKELQTIGASFMLHNATLVTAIYGEQLILNTLSGEQASVALFRHVAVFTPIALGFSGFAGFVIAPKIRAMQVIKPYQYRRFLFISGGVGLATVGLSLVVGLGIHYFVFLDDFEIFWPLVAVMMGTCWLRAIYVVPSSVIGTLADAAILRRTALANWLFLALYLIVAVIIVGQLSVLHAALAVAILSFLNWCCRIAYASYCAVVHVSVKENYNE